MAWCSCPSLSAFGEVKVRPACASPPRSSHSLSTSTGYALTADDGDGSWIASAVGTRYESEQRGFLADDGVDSEDDEY